MRTPLDELAEGVAAAKRKSQVAMALVSEYRSKLRFADEDYNAAERELRAAEIRLMQEAFVVNEEAHGSEYSSDDRQVFEERWAKTIAIKQERLRRYEAGLPMDDPLSPSHPDHPNHIHEDCCK